MTKCNFISVFIIALMLSGGSAHADSGVSRQIADAIAKGDYKTAQTLIAQNPEQGGAVEIVLLSLADASASANPQKTMQLMTLGSNVSPYLDDASASKIAEGMRKLVDDVMAAATSKGNDKAAGYTPDDTVAILNSALTIAQSKFVNARDLKLAPWIQEQLVAFAENNDVLLAQLPPQNPNSNGANSRFFRSQDLNNTNRIVSNPPPNPPAQNSGGSAL